MSITVTDVEFDEGKRTFSGHVAIDATDGNERSNQLFEIFAQLFIDIVSGPRIEFDMHKGTVSDLAKSEDE